MIQIHFKRLIFNSKSLKIRQKRLKYVKKSLDRVFLLYQSIAFLMVDLRGLEPRYATQSKLLSTRLVYSKSSLALSEQTSQKLTTLYYIHLLLLE